MNNNVTAQYAFCYDLFPFVFFFMFIRVLSIKGFFFGYLGYGSIFKQQRYFYDSLCPSLCQLTLTKVILSFPPLFPIVFCLFVSLSVAVLWTTGTCFCFFFFFFFSTVLNIDIPTNNSVCQCFLSLKTEHEKYIE